MFIIVHYNYIFILKQYFFTYTENSDGHVNLLNNSFGSSNSIPEDSLASSLVDYFLDNSDENNITNINQEQDDKILPPSKKLKKNHNSKAGEFEQKSKETANWQLLWTLFPTAGNSSAKK